jgi:peptidoglycan/xylan/chitin deacetylase (PgdA/CDA1 family)
MFGRAFEEFYRCPEGMIDLAPVGEPSGGPGFFRFSPQAMGYGRLAGGGGKQKANAELPDVSGQVSVSGSTVRLPFDPTEVLDNLRLERYPHRGLGGAKEFLKWSYYLLRPLTGRSLRSQIQKFHARQSRWPVFPKWPVDTSVENICSNILLRVLQGSIESFPFVWFWPRGSEGCVVMTHDVETAAGRDFCPALLDLNDSFGVKASFQIVPEDRYSVPRELLEEIRNRGSEVVVQDLNHDGRLFDNRDEFLRRAARIRRHANEFGSTGFRAAVLYRNPDWYADLGFSYDMSVPNVAHLDPQVGGCCTVMPYFIGDTLEIPVTTTQDYALFHLLNERSIDLWKAQTEEILAKHGMASFIVHPDYILEPEAQRLYSDLLTYLRGLQESGRVWFALPREIDAWWRARSRMLVVRSGDSWRIAGAGSENAMLAFAKLDGGQLTYDLQPSA